MMPIYKREVIMAGGYRPSWLHHEQEANGYFNFLVNRINGGATDHRKWMTDNDIQPSDYYRPGPFVFFANENHAVMFYLAWGR